MKFFSAAKERTRKKRKEFFCLLIISDSLIYIVIGFFCCRECVQTSFEIYLRLKTRRKMQNGTQHCNLRCSLASFGSVTTQLKQQSSSRNTFVWNDLMNNARAERVVLNAFYASRKRHTHAVLKNSRRMREICYSPFLEIKKDLMFTFSFPLNSPSNTKSIYFH